MCGADDCLWERNGEAKRSGEAEAVVDGDGDCDGFNTDGLLLLTVDGELMGDGEPLDTNEAVLPNELITVTLAADAAGDVDAAGAVACSGGRCEAGEATDDDGHGDVYEKVLDGDGVVGVDTVEAIENDV